MGNGEICYDQNTTIVVESYRQQKVTNVYKDNYVGDVTKERRLNCYYRETIYNEKQCISQNDQTIYKQTYYKEQCKIQGNDQKMWHDLQSKRFDAIGQNRGRNNWFKRRNINQNTDNMMNDIPRENTYRRNKEPDNNNVTFRNDQHNFREPHNVQGICNNEYKNYFDNNSRNLTENYSTPRIDTKKIPSLLDMIISMPSEFQKLNHDNYYSNINNNTAPMPFTLSNDIVVDDTFNNNENINLHSTPNANFMTKNHNDKVNSTIQEEKEEKEEELATPYNYDFTLDSSDDEFNDLVKNGEPVLVQKPPKVMPMRNQIRPTMIPLQINHQQTMSSNTHRVFRGHRNPRQKSRNTAFQKRNYNKSY